MGLILGLIWKSYQAGVFKGVLSYSIGRAAVSRDIYFSAESLAREQFFCRGVSGCSSYVQKRYSPLCILKGRSSRLMSSKRNLAPGKA
jgi:hypothetical protein